MYDALVVADDLTGANDAGHEFAARGYATRVSAEGAAPGADVLVRETDSRDLPPETAAGRVERAVDAHDAARVYKKVDSTLRGNVVAETDAALGAAGAPLAVVAPAFPAQGRTTVGGVHLADGAPVASATLPELFADSRYPVEHCGLATVEAGADAVRSALAAVDGPAVVTCDATRDRHLAAVAEAAGSDALLVGSAGLARHARLGDRGAVLGVVGSVAATTLDQLDELADAAVVDLAADRLVAGDDEPVGTAVDAVLEALAAGDRAVVTAARSPADVDATLAAGRAAGLDESEVRDRVARGLGRVAARAVERRRPAGLFVTGGATAARTVDALDARGVDLAGRAVDDGIPVGRLAGGTADGLPMVTKAGGFGGRETIVNCIEVLSRSNG